MRIILKLTNQHYINIHRWNRWSTRGGYTVSFDNSGMLTVVPIAQHRLYTAGGR